MWWRFMCRGLGVWLILCGLSSYMVVVVYMSLYIAKPLVA